MDGEAHEFRAPVPRVWAREGAASAGTGTVTTPMPGRIIKARWQQLMCVLMSPGELSVLHGIMQVLISVQHIRV